MDRDRNEVIKAGIFGTVVGDAIGEPVEFTSRTDRRLDPVTDMREYGTHSQPKGTWSDDSSMMLATLDSIINNGGVNYEDMMTRFRDWKINGNYTPHGCVFDVGITCARAIGRYRPGMDPLECGETGDRDNGNGSLMRIIPVSLYVGIEDDYWNDSLIKDAAEKVHGASRLTHGHPRSQIGCMIYTSICHELMYRGSRSVIEAIQDAIDGTFSFYRKAKGIMPWYDDAFEKEIQTDAYGRMRISEIFKSLPESEIKSGGYVVHTLEAAVWCLMNSDSFASCVLKAVNLGDDTDTVGAVAGGLAGLCYGYDSIPKDWLDVIVSKDWIEKLCDDFTHIMDK